MHIEDEQGRFINHSCNPSVRIKGNKVIALRDIDPLKEITFNYSEMKIR